MRAIILAAGAGRRLGLDGPKSMIDVGGRSILRRQIDAFASVGVDDFVIVVGYQRERIAEHLAGLPGKFTFVVNERFAETNTVYSLYLARQYIPGGKGACSPPNFAFSQTAFSSFLRLQPPPRSSGAARPGTSCGTAASSTFADHSPAPTLPARRR